MSSEGRPGVVVEDEATPPASASLSNLKLVVAEAADKGTEKSTEVAELGAARTLSTGCVGARVVEFDGALVLVVLDVVDVTLGGTARLSFWFFCCPCSSCRDGGGYDCDCDCDVEAGVEVDANADVVEVLLVEFDTW